MTKHKVFISYYHKDDEEYKNKFEDLFGDIFINKSVKEGDINSELSDEYIKRLIREDYISDSSVVVVLVGPHTYCRKHIDWEIYAGLDNNAGLIGLILPTHSCYSKKKCSNIPKRLAKNVNSDYAKLYNWNENKETMKKMIEEAFENRIKLEDKKEIGGLQMKENRCN
ncbi:MAG: TIR domain-containing protein [Methanobrevibacter sp.]|nr:TIR domain-containing protein [Methanobrevibacter sp.]